MRTPGCEVSHDDGVAIARLHGDIDLVNVPALGERLRDAAGCATLGIVVDLGAVRYLDSAGVQMLFQLGRDLAITRKGVVLALPPDAPIATLLEITSMRLAVAVHPSLDASLAALRGGDFPQY